MAAFNVMTDYSDTSFAALAAPLSGAHALGEFMTFAAIGAGAAAGYAVLVGLLVAAFPGVPAGAIAACCYAAFIGPVYLLHRHFSFRSNVAHRVALPRYVTVQLLAMAFAGGFTSLSYGVLGGTSWLAPFLGIVMTMGVNFFAVRAWAFARAA